jgi:hypothetical protein
MADKKEQTEYVVLVQNDNGTWDELAKVKATSQGAAKRAALTAAKPDGGTVVAIPERSWEPEDLKPKLSFG